MILCLKESCKTFPNSPKFHTGRDNLPCPLLSWLFCVLNVSIDSACSFILTSLGFEGTSVTSVMYCNCRCYYSCFIKARSIPWVTARLNLIPCLSLFQSALSAIITFCNKEPLQLHYAMPGKVYPFTLSSLSSSNRVFWSCFIGKGSRSAGWYHLHHYAASPHTLIQVQLS